MPPSWFFETLLFTFCIIWKEVPLKANDSDYTFRPAEILIDGASLKPYLARLMQPSHAVAKVGLGSAFLCTLWHPQNGNLYGIMTSNRVIGAEIFQRRGYDSRVDLVFPQRSITLFLQNDVEAYFTDKDLDATFIELRPEVRQLLTSMNLNFLSISETPIKVGEDVFVSQYPQDRVPYFSEGRLLAVEGHYVKHTVQQGSSGSPILKRDSNGKYKVVALHSETTANNRATSILSIANETVRRGLTQVQSKPAMPIILEATLKFDDFLQAALVGNLFAIDNILRTVPRHHLLNEDNWRYLSTEINDNGDSPLHRAARGDVIQVVKLLWFEMRESAEWFNAAEKAAPIHVAAIHNSIKVVDFFAHERPAHLELKESMFGQTPLNIAARQGHEDLVKLLVVKYKRKVDVKTIHLASYFDHKGVVEFLLTAQPSLIWALDSDGNSPLHSAALGGKVNVIEYLVAKKGANVNLREKSFNRTALHLAALNGNFQAVKVLTKTLKANVHARSNQVDLLSMPIHLAASAGHEKIVDFFLTHSNESAINVKDSEGNQPIHRAAMAGHTKLVNSLIEKLRLNVDSRQESLGRTPLHIAAAEGHLGLIEALLTKGANIFSVTNSNDGGSTAIHLATRFNRYEAVDDLLRFEEKLIVAKDANGNQPIHVASLAGHYGLVLYFLSQWGVSPNVKNDVTGRRPLHIAANEGHLDIVRLLAQLYGANTTLKSSKKDDLSLPIHLAAKRGNLDVVKFFVESNPNLLFVKDRNSATPIKLASGTPVAQWLLLKQADLLLGASEEGNTPAVEKLLSITPRGNLVSETLWKMCNERGDSPLHRAARTGRIDIIKTLWPVIKELSEYRNVEKQAPIHVATLSNSGEVAEYFIKERKFLLDLKDGQGRTPLHLAIAHGHLALTVKLIKTYKANLTAEDDTATAPIVLAAQSENPLFLKLFLNVKPELLYFKDKSGNRLIHIAAYAGRTGVIEYLLNRHRDDVNNILDLRNDRQLTPLLIAAERGHLLLFNYLQVSELRAPPASSSKNSSTVFQLLPIHVAAGQGHLPIVRFFLEHVDSTLVNAVDERNYRPLHHAVMGGQIEVAEYLLSLPGQSVEMCGGLGCATPLHLAVLKEGNLEMVKLLTSKKYKGDVYARMSSSHSGSMPIHLAAELGRSDVVSFFIETDRCLLYAKDNQFHTPRHRAQTTSPRLVEFLLFKQAELLLNASDSRNLSMITEVLAITPKSYLINASTWKNVNVWADSPLHRAARAGHIDAVRVLWSQMNETAAYENNKKEAAIHVAVIENAIQVVDFFVTEKRSLLELKEGASGLTPLLLAVRFGHVDLVKLLVRKYKANVFAKSSSASGEQMAVHLATLKYVNKEILQVLLDADQSLIKAIDGEGNLPIHRAVASGKSDIVDYLLSRPLASVGAQMKLYNFTPLHMACVVGNLATVELLLERHRANISDESVLKIDEIAPNFMLQPFHLAVAAGHLGIVKYLLEQRYPGLLEKCEETSVSTFAATAMGHVEIVDYLLSKCPNLGVDDRVGPLGQGLLHQASMYGQLEVVKLLVKKYKADVSRESGPLEMLSPINVATAYGKLPVVEYFLQIKPELINESMTIDGNQFIHIAASTGQAEMVDYLIMNRSVNVDLRNGNKNNNGSSYTALHLAADKGNLKIVRLLVLRYKANVYARSSEASKQVMPIHLAARSGRLDVVKFLVEMYPDLVDAKTADGMTPAEIAAVTAKTSKNRKVQQEVIEWLRSKSAV